MELFLSSSPRWLCVGRAVLFPGRLVGTAASCTQGRLPVCLNRRAEEAAWLSHVVSARTSGEGRMKFFFPFSVL